MRSGHIDSRRVPLALVLATVFVSPAVQPATDRAEGTATKPLWQFETGG
jgi:hypothetical protein